MRSMLFLPNVLKEPKKTTGRDKILPFHEIRHRSLLFRGRESRSRAYKRTTFNQWKTSIILLRFVFSVLFVSLALIIFRVLCDDIGVEIGVGERRTSLPLDPHESKQAKQKTVGNR